MMAKFGPHHGKFTASPLMHRGSVTKKTIHQSTVFNAGNNYRPPAVAVSSGDRTQTKVQKTQLRFAYFKSTDMGEDKTRGFKDWAI